LYIGSMAVSFVKSSTLSPEQKGGQQIALVFFCQLFNAKTNNLRRYIECECESWAVESNVVYPPHPPSLLASPAVLITGRLPCQWNDFEIRLCGLISS